MAFKIKNKTGQITIFIIIALILVVLIALIFVAKGTFQVQPIDEKSPQSFIESCTKEAVENALYKIGMHGDIDTSPSVMYESLNITYLCYTSQYYQKCVNQRPRLVEHIQDEITNYIRQNISDCFDSLKLVLEKRYDINMGEMKLNTILKDKEVVVEINRKFKMSREDKSREFDNFKISLMHPMYEFASIASEIVNQEAHYCNFDTLGFMIIYPDYDITKFKTGDSDTIYKIKDRTSDKEYNFAVRSCIMPPGI